MDWIKEVLHELEKLIGKASRERIFVLSVMGVQSSGKSTLLNTMFGIQMRTSVGQCTRGVNMQLLKVEGRQEYDYILLLDTEGTRSPEYHGLPGSEKRDNQMATLSILLADATIVVIPGENDAAIKEILPIVLMAYQGSKLAEINGGRRSSMLFFVYNRIDTTQKDKLGTIVQTLGTSLNEAFNQVHSLTGKSNQSTKEELFRSFKLGVANSSDSDVCILGNVKKEFEPPGDVPNAAYGDALVKFREHIHRRVTNTTDGATWTSRTVAELFSYMELVWTCICSANFTLTFASVVERMVFDSLDSEYKKIEQKLVEEYRKCFQVLSKKMVKEKGEAINASATEFDELSRLQHFEFALLDNISPVELNLDAEVDEMLKKSGREKWSLQFQQQWESCKRDQQRNWTFTLKTSFATLFNYENHVENYKKKSRKKIDENLTVRQHSSNMTETEKRELFHQIYNPILEEAKRDFPPKDIASQVAKVYQNSNIIKHRKIEMDNEEDRKFCEECINLIKSSERKGQPQNPERSLFSDLKKFFQPLLRLWTKNKEPSPLVMDCFVRVHTLVNSIVIGKLCYDDSIVSSVINDTEDIIKSNKIEAHSEVKIVHVFSRTFVTKVMEEIQSEWEKKNSIYAKLEQDREAMYNHFLMVCQGVEKSNLFAGHMANVLKTAVPEAFEKEMVQKTSNRIRNQRWLHDARFIHKHMDLYLCDLLEKKKLSQVLDCIRNPKGLYQIVLKQLIAQKVPDVDELWPSYIRHLKRQVEAAALATLDVVNGRAQKFVDVLREELLKYDGLQNECLAKAFLIDCSGEYEDCDNEDNKEEFQEVCVSELFKVLDRQKSPQNQQQFAKQLSTKVIDYMKTLNDSAAMPRCDACCPHCKSLCIEAANHDTTLKPHDAIHQPRGITGVGYRNSRALVTETCSQFFIIDWGFYMTIDGTETLQKYRDFSKVYPDWMDPKINEEIQLRQYIVATYHEDIAKKYDIKPCTNIPSNFPRDLATIREQLKRDTAESPSTATESSEAN